jgi:hypothetical protein
MKVLFAIALLPLLLPQSAGQGKEVDVTGVDGVKLRGTYTSPGKPGPGIVLFHQCNMLRGAWTSMAAALVERGVHTLAIDYRGMGDNKAVPNDYGQRASDAGAVLAALAAMPGVDANRIAAGGASCGVDQAVQLARRSGPKLPSLRGSEALEFAEALFERRDCDVDVARRVPDSVRHGAPTRGALGLRSHDNQED